jgi:hypothetical protein
MSKHVRFFGLAAASELLLLGLALHKDITEIIFIVGVVLVASSFIILEMVLDKWGD